ncbi:MAG: hypothetical protein IJW70_01940 [Clostridia bacterium]|nr:hypothetical protein [Clostridia bacterium]
MNDIELIYDKVKDKYRLTLTNTSDLDDGFTWSVPVICGEREQARFWLYADADVPEPHGIEFVFSVEYQKRTLFGKGMKTCHTHWHPQSIEQAAEDVDSFMRGDIPLPSFAHRTE